MKNVKTKKNTNKTRLLLEKSLALGKPRTGRTVTDPRFEGKKITTMVIRNNYDECYLKSNHLNETKKRRAQTCPILAGFGDVTTDYVSITIVNACVVPFAFVFATVGAASELRMLEMIGCPYRIFLVFCLPNAPQLNMGLQTQIIRIIECVLKMY